MSQLYTYINSDFASVVITALFHSLWQGLLFASLIYVAFSLISKASVRYVVAYASFLAFILSNIATFFILKARKTADVISIGQESQVDYIYASASTISNSLTGALGISPEFSDYIFMFWLLGLLLISIKMIGGLLFVYKMRSMSRIVINPEILALLNDLKTRARITVNVQLKEVKKLSAPIVTGFLKPIILFPIGSINALSFEETEAILAHELAHISRYDYALNLFQVFVETLYYFNPFVWWMSKLIREEREKACDDRACAIINNKMQYVHALVKMKELELGNGRFAMSFSGNKNQLFNRISRLLGSPVKKPFIMEKITVLIVSLVLIVFFSSARLAENIAEPNINCEENIFIDTYELCESVQDTIPEKKVKKTIIKEEEGKKVELEIENDEISSLKIDGEKIEKNKLKEYDELIKELKGELNANSQGNNFQYRVLPGNRFFEESGERNAKLYERLAEREAREHRKSDNRFFFENEQKVIVESEKDDDGNTILRIESDDSNEPIIISIPENSEEIIINGERLDGEDEIIIGGGNFFYSPKIASRIRKHPNYQNFNFNFDNEAAKVYIEKLKEFNNDQFVWTPEGFSNYRVLSRPKSAKRNRDQAIFHFENAAKDYEIAKLKMKERKDRLPRAFVMPEHNFQFELAEVPSVFAFPGQIGSSQIENKLMRDGLIKDKENYEFKMTNRKLKINGKRQSSDIFETYKRFVEKTMGKVVDSDFNMHIKKNNK